MAGIQGQAELLEAVWICLEELPEGQSMYFVTLNRLLEVGVAEEQQLEEEGETAYYRIVLEVYLILQNENEKFTLSFGRPKKLSSYIRT